MCMRTAEQDSTKIDAGRQNHHKNGGQQKSTRHGFEATQAASSGATAATRVLEYCNNLTTEGRTNSSTYTCTREYHGTTSVCTWYTYRYEYSIYKTTHTNALTYR